MILEHNVLPSNIVAVTFTNKAAKEMKERLKKLIEPKKVESLVMGVYGLFVAIPLLTNTQAHSTPYASDI